MKNHPPHISLDLSAGRRRTDRVMLPGAVALIAAASPGIVKK